MMKGFKESDEGCTFRSALSSGHLTYQKQVLAAYLNNKIKEIAQLKKLITSEALLDTVQPVVQEHY